jgi:hypothetical protein
VHIEIEPSWSREQIASAIRLTAAGVSEKEVLAMMGVSSSVFSAWKSAYAQTFRKLTKTVGVRRVAYFSAWLGHQLEVESALQACKIGYSVVGNWAEAVRELVKSGFLLANLQAPVQAESSAPIPSSSFNGSSSHATPTSHQNEERPLMLVSVQGLDQEDLSVQPGIPADERKIAGAVSTRIDELMWSTCLGYRGPMDESIVGGVPMRFSLEAILDGPVDAIRIFFTSSMDVLLLGNCLIQKSEIGRLATGA